MQISTSELLGSLYRHCRDVCTLNILQEQLYQLEPKDHHNHSGQPVVVSDQAHSSGTSLIKSCMGVLWFLTDFSSVRGCCGVFGLCECLRPVKVQWPQVPQFSFAGSKKMPPFVSLFYFN